MTEPKTDERTIGGLAGKVTGNAKELAGELTNNDDLAGEGNSTWLRSGSARPRRPAARARTAARSCDAVTTAAFAAVATAERSRHRQIALSDASTPRQCRPARGAS